MEASSVLGLLETPDCKRRWHKPDYPEQERIALTEWLVGRIEQVAKARKKAFTIGILAASIFDDPRVLAVCEVLTNRKDFNVAHIVATLVQNDAVPNHRFHLYKPTGLLKREAWERTWDDQRREDAGEVVTPEVPPAYGSGDFLKADFWRLRGKLDVPKERFIAFTEVPEHPKFEPVFGWAGWNAEQRLRAILEIDEDLEDIGVHIEDRIGLIESAWRLLPDVEREDFGAAARLKREVQALVGPDGPSRVRVEDWKKRFPPPTSREARAKRAAVARGGDCVVDVEGDGEK
jgi:hypothetical protein